MSSDLDKLAELIESESETLLARWRQQLRQLESARHLDTPTLNDHIPQFLRELVAALKSASHSEILRDSFNAASPPAHGSQRFEDGFNIVEIVTEYNMLRGCIHDLADAKGLNLHGTPFRVINHVFDGAIGMAVETFSEQCALDVQQRREEYLAFVAHDLRTPLHAISLATDVLEHKLPEDIRKSTIAQMLKTLRRGVEQLAGLVEKVLEENIHLETDVGIKVERRRLDMWPLVEALVHDLRPVSETGGTQLINAVPDDLVVFADASLLRRIFQNLIANAIRYTPHGQVRIEARNLGPSSGIECAVVDNGSGIAPNLLDRVFDKGETDPDFVGGTGLGLAIVKSFVEAQGGTITAESEVGSGSTFRFTLPDVISRPVSSKVSEPSI